MDSVFSTTQRLLGYIPEADLWEMTPRYWNNLIKGARHQMIDEQEVQITGAVAMARMNNGQNIKAMMRSLNERRALIDKSEDQHEYDKAIENRRREHVREVQKEELREWYKQLNR